ncbi:MAG: hypothetical protein LBD70_04120, partial [Bifidobacteriaceae bacterium]|nr:hypothetical protein [Bifidobacteriaceae bacterium]
MALATAAVVVASSGLAGLATPAEATKYLDGWNGIFSRSQLYGIGGGQLNSAYAWDQPWTVAALPAAKRIFDKSQGTDGSSTSNIWETFAVGPVYAATGDYTLHGVGWYSTASSPVTLMERDNSRRQLNAYAMTPFSGSVGGRACTGGSALSGEINQKDGTVYAIMSSANQAFAANAAPATGVRLSIFRVAKTASGTRTVSCVATNGGQLVPATQTIYEAWSSQFSGTPPFTPESNWALASDLAIDANGDAYVFGHNAANRHVLLRVNIPRTADDQPDPRGEYTYEVVRFFTETSNNNANYGLTFMNARLYVQDSLGRMWRYDPLDGVIENLGAAGLNSPKDLASAQMAPVVKGTVFEDANANSVRDSGEAGVSGVVIEIWQNVAGSNPARWNPVGSVVTDRQGAYSSLAPTAAGDFLIRVRQPKLGGVNATQTYASAGQFRFRNGSPNVVLAYCFNQAGDYRPITESGPCHGARADGIDPPATLNPVAAAGGAAIVSHVAMSSDLAVATADFGITAAGSWGDAPAVYKTTNAQGGPYANPGIGSDNYLYLGARAGIYRDGQPDAAADAHPTDDSLELATKIPGKADADLTWRAAQDQILVEGQTYRVRAKASGLAAAVASAHVKAWVTSLTAAGTAATSMDQALLGGAGCADAPDANGYVYCDYQPGATPPGVAIASVFARVRVGESASFTATSRGPANSVTGAWAPKGEIEDYRLGVAGAVVRIEARNLAGLAADVDLALTNVSAVQPSSAQDLIATGDQGAFAGSSKGHALVSRTATTVITTVGVGKAGSGKMNGWTLGQPGAGEAACRDTIDGADLGAAVDSAAGKVTIPVPSSGQLPGDITCQLTYLPTVDPAASSVTADPSGNSAQADRLVIPDSTALVKVAVAGSVEDAAGDGQNRPAAGASVKLDLAGGPGASA